MGTQGIRAERLWRDPTRLSCNTDVLKLYVALELRIETDRVAWISSS